MPYKKILKALCLLVALACAAIVFMIADVQWHYLDRMNLASVSLSQPADAADATALILGASVTGGGLPSDALKDRLDQGIALYGSGANTLMISGDDGRFRAGEIPVMKAYLLTHGIPQSSILVDGTGFRTYESCKHAAMQLQGHLVIIVTQRFHLGRALYLCNQMGLKAFGVAADRPEGYRRIVFFTLREILASAKAWWDIHIYAPAPPVSF